MRGRSARRRHGLVLDGPVLTSATTEQGRVVAAGTLVADSAAEAMQRWWEGVRPRGPVTVAVISDAAQVATVDIGDDVPPGLVRRHVESRLQSAAPALPSSFAVAARLPDAGGSPATCVAAVPVTVMERLWPAERRGARFTVPAMAFTIVGVHLLVAHTASELVLVDGERGRPVAAVLLAAGGIAAGSDTAARAAHAEQVAEEVDRAVESWRRRGLAVDSDVVHVTGAGVGGDDLFDALALRGYRPRLDLVTEQLDADALRAALRADRAAVLRGTLAAAVAVCDPGPLGFLTPPGPHTARRPVARARQVIEATACRSTGAPVAHRGRRVLLAAGCALVVAVAATVAWAVPSSIGARTVAAARSRHAQAAALDQRLAPDIALAQHDRRLGADATALAGPPWATIVPAIEATVPPGVDLQSLDVTDDGSGRLAVSVTATALDDALIPSWLSRLRGVHVTASTPAVTVDRTGLATFSTTFDVPRDFG